MYAYTLSLSHAFGDLIFNEKCKHFCDAPLLQIMMHLGTQTMNFDLPLTSARGCFTYIYRKDTDKLVDTLIGFVQRWDTIKIVMVRLCFGHDYVRK